MRPRLIPVDALTEADVAAWRELVAAAVEPNPFFEPAFVLPAAAHLRPGGIALLVAEDAAGWTACLPVQRRMRPAPHLRAWVHDHAHCSTPHVRADAVVDGCGALLDALTRPLLAAWSGLHQLRADGPVGLALRSLVVERGIVPLYAEGAERAALLPRSEHDDAELLSAKQRSELRRKLRRLGETLDADPVVVDVAGEDEAASRLLALENSGWKGEGGSSLLHARGGAHFFLAACRAFAAEGRLELLELRAGDRPLAMTSALRAGNGVFGWKVGDDRELGRWSPGMQVQVALGEKVLSEGAHTWVDSCSDPRNRTQNRMWPHRRRIMSLLLPTRSPLTRVAGVAARRALATHDAAPATRGRSAGAPAAVGG